MYVIYTIHANIKHKTAQIGKQSTATYKFSAPKLSTAHALHVFCHMNPDLIKNKARTIYLNSKNKWSLSITSSFSYSLVLINFGTKKCKYSKNFSINKIWESKRNKLRMIYAKLK